MYSHRLECTLLTPAILHLHGKLNIYSPNAQSLYKFHPIFLQENVIVLIMLLQQFQKSRKCGVFTRLSMSLYPHIDSLCIPPSIGQEAYLMCCNRNSRREQSRSHIYTTTRTPVESFPQTFPFTWTLHKFLWSQKNPFLCFFPLSLHFKCLSFSQHTV